MLFVSMAFLAYAAPGSWELRGRLALNSTIQQAALSPDGAYVVVIYHEGFRVLLGVYDSWLRPLWSVELASGSSHFAFVEDGLLVVVERLFGQVPSTRVSIYRLASGEPVYSDVKRGGFSEQVLVAHRLGSFLYLLTSRELVAIDLDKKGGMQVLLSFANRGLQALSTEDGLLVLYIDTLCRICLERNEKTVAFVKTPDRVSKITLEEILALVSVDGKPALYTANGSLLALNLGEKVEPGEAKPGPLLSGYVQASEPGYRLLYSKNIQGLDVDLLLLDPAASKIVARRLPLPYEKGDVVGVRVYDDGSFVAWCKNTSLVGSLEGNMSIITLDFPVRSVYLGNTTLLVVGTRILATYTRSLEAGSSDARFEKVYTLHLIVREKDQGVPDSFMVFVNGSFKGTFSGFARLLLPEGFYKVSVVAPGYQEATFGVNLFSNTTVHVILERRKFTLLVQAEEEGSPPPEILLLRDSSIVARGFGILEVAVTPGTYTLEIRGLHRNYTRSVTVQGDTSIYFYLLVEQAAPPQLPLSENLNARETINVTAVVMYGSENCPSCRRVREILVNLGAPLDYRDLSNRSYLEEYYHLYDYIGAGSQRVIPLVLIFRGQHLSAAVSCGSLTQQEWQELLQQSYPNATIVVQDDCTRVVRGLNSSEAYRMVFGAREVSRGKSMESLLPLLLALAAADSINPCTFLVFSALLVTTLAAAGRRRTIKASAAFISAVFLCYMLLGLGLIRVVSHFWWLRSLVTLAVVAVGIYEVSRGVRSARDDIARLMEKSPRLKLPSTLASIPGSARLAAARTRALLMQGSLHRIALNLKGFVRAVEAAMNTLLLRAREGSMVMAALAGAAVSLTLLPCSSGPYLVATLALSELPLSRALLYLVLYNLVFVLPLVVIALSVLLGERYLASVEIFRMRAESARKYLDIAIGAVLLALGVYIFFL